MKCSFPKCNVHVDLVVHHITYTAPKSGIKPQTAVLCPDHHDRITALNSLLAFKRGNERCGQMSNEERVNAYRKWTEGEYLVVNFAEAKKIKMGEYAYVSVNEARNHSYVVLGKNSRGEYVVEGYANGTQFELCPTCGSKLNTQTRLL